MNTQAHLSIGEVLSLLQEEFPDVTISKIRFLESQGLLDPERTPSGYRKFYEADIDQLRWILTQQKENFLPLKVIKDRMAGRDDDEADRDDDEDDGIEGGGPQATAEPRAGAVGEPAVAPVWMADAAKAAAARGGRASARPSLFDGATSGATEAAAPDAASATAPQRTAKPGAADRTPRPSVSDRTAGSDRPARLVGSDKPAGSDRLARPAAPPVERRSATPLDVGPTTVSLTLAELASASNLSIDQLKELEGFGLLEGRKVGAEVFYDGNALVVAQKSAGFIARGIEPRHLRMFKVAAEREAGFLEQVVMPMVKQRNPAAREQAVATLGELASLGQSMRAALLRNALRDYLS